MLGVSFANLKSHRLIQITHSHDYPSNGRLHDHPELPGQEWPAFPSDDSSQHPDKEDRPHHHLVLLTQDECAGVLDAAAHAHSQVERRMEAIAMPSDIPECRIIGRLLRPPRRMSLA